MLFETDCASRSLVKLLARRAKEILSRFACSSNLSMISKLPLPMGSSMSVLERLHLMRKEHCAAYSTLHTATQREMPTGPTTLMDETLWASSVLSLHSTLSSYAAFFAILERHLVSTCLSKAHLPGEHASFPLRLSWASSLPSTPLSAFHQKTPPR